jgi:predicted nucleic acid-binding protein
VIHLDTSFLIRSLLRETEESRHFEQWLRRDDAVRISALVWAEFLCGPIQTSDAQDAAELLGEPLALTGLDATLGAHFFNLSARRRGSLADCLIAASAVNAGASLATSDLDHFSRFRPYGLTMVKISQAARP